MPDWESSTDTPIHGEVTGGETSWVSFSLLRVFLFLFSGHTEYSVHVVAACVSLLTDTYAAIMVRVKTI